MHSLDVLAKRQAAWSSTANHLKWRYDLARRATFGLSILAALAATVASQRDDPTRLVLSVASAVMLGVVAFLSARLLTSAHAEAWVHARATSEALKREGWKFAASAAPYDDPAKRENTLNDERERIERDADALLGKLRPSAGSGSVPTALCTQEEYITKRVLGQVEKYYQPNADAYQKKASWLRAAEFILALTASVITAAVGVAGKDLFELKFDFVALTAFLTTVAGAILAHLEASQFDQLVITYRATARRLSNELARHASAGLGAPADWSAFVNRCEAIISEENTSWVAKWNAPR